MTFCVVTASGRFFLSRGDHGQWEFTPDRSARAKFRSRAEAERAHREVIAGMTGGAAIVGEVGDV